MEANLVSWEWGGNWSRQGERRRVGDDCWRGHWHLADDWLVSDHWRVDSVLDDRRGDHVVVGNLVAGLNGVALDVCRWGWVHGLDGGWGWHGRDNGHSWSGGGNWRWSGHCDWGWRGHGERGWSSDGNWRGSGQRHWGVVAHVRLEGVAVDVGGAANNLVADLLVADNGVSGLDGLQNGGGRGDGVHGWGLGNQALAVHGGQGGHGGHRWHCSDGWRGDCGGFLVRCNIFVCFSFSILFRSDSPSAHFRCKDFVVNFHQHQNVNQRNSSNFPSIRT